MRCSLSVLALVTFALTRRHIDVKVALFSSVLSDLWETF